MAADPKELGTLIVVVGKARNLPNKSRFGKQDPFCTVKVGEDKQRTKAIKRGGQHPEWDEELRFSLFEDTEDILARSESQSTLSSAQPPLPPKDQPGVITSAALASKSRLGPVGKKGGKAMRVACYADDAKEPELIGECVVNFEEVLKKGEVDEWYEFTYKEKYSGEVYLELTYYSNDVPPVRRNVPRPSVNYGGAGVFNPSSSSSSLSGKPPGGLAASGSVSGMSLYIPPYVQQGRTSPAPQIAPSSSFMELGLPPGHLRKQSLPQTLSSYPSHAPQTSAFDAITNNLSTMSLGQSFSSRPLPTATPAPHVPSHHSQRHSLSVAGEAPWSQHVQPPAPQSRPVSTNDIAAWDHRDNRIVTPVRPLSQAGYSGYEPQPTHTYPPTQPPTDYRAPSPVPPSLQPSGPPRPDYTHHPASNLGLPPSGSSYRIPSPSPTPPAPSHTAPPMNATGHYQMPASSFSNQPPPQSSYYQPLPESYRDQSNGYQSEPQSYPSQQEYSRIHPPPSRPIPDSTGDYSQQSHPHSAPPAQGQEYVPWYQQTSNAQPPPNHHRPDQGYQTQPPSQVYDQRRQESYPGSYQSVPPPPPPRPQGVGYYPSDELYAQPRSHTPQPAPPPTTNWNQGYNPNSQNDHAYSNANNNNQTSYAAPTPQASWQSTSQPYGRAPSPAPPSQSYGRAPSPAPPAQPYYQDQRAHSPAPPPSQTNYQNPVSPYPLSNPNQNGWSQSPTTLLPPRSHSPLPPSIPATQTLPHLQHDQRVPSPSPSPSMNMNTTTSTTTNRTSNSDWRSYMQSLGTGTTSTPSPVAEYHQAGQSGYTNPDGRTSPLPPSQSYPQQSTQAQAQAQPQGGGAGGQWYTPPPSLPASIRPPEGWKSTLPLPTEAGGHQWRT